MPTPSILLIPDRYKAAVLYSQIPDSGAVDFDVTRATTAYRTNASGTLESVASGVPRLDYPSAGGCPSLLVEPAATNLLLRSEEFGDASWTKTNTTITSNSSTAPNNTTTADKLVENSTTSEHYIEQQFTSVVGIMRMSIYVKAEETTRIALYESISNRGAIYNLTTGQIEGGLPSGWIAADSPIIQNIGGGYYRCSFQVNFASAISRFFRCYLLRSDNTLSYLGNGTNGAFIWGAQLETGSVATSYIPTVAATATRNADVISKTGVSGFIGQAEGVVYAEVDIANPDKSIIRTILGIGDGTVANRFSIRRDTNGRIIVICVVGSSTLGFVQTGNDQLGVFKIAVAYAVNDLTMYVNGASIGTTTIASVPACSRIDVGKLEGTGTTNQLNDRIRAAAIYPTRLLNAELAALTTL